MVRPGPKLRESSGFVAYLTLADAFAFRCHAEGLKRGEEVSADHEAGLDAPGTFEPADD